MESYLILWSLILISYSIGKVSNIKIIFPALACLLLSLVFGLREKNFGTDTNEYHAIYNDFSFSASSLELLANLHIAFFKNFNLPAEAWIFSYFFLFILFLIKSIILNSWKDDPLLLIISTFPFISFSINIIRAGLAFAIFLYACAIYSKQDKISINQILLFTLSSLIHFSIIVPIIFFITFDLLRNKYIYRYIRFLWIPSILFYILKIDAVGALVEIINNGLIPVPQRFSDKIFFYENIHSQESLTLGGTYLIILITFIIYNFNSILKKNINRNLFLSISFFMTSIYLTAYPLLVSYSTYARVNLYFEFFSYFLIHFLISITSPKKISYLMTLIIPTFFFFKNINNGLNNGSLLPIF